MFLNIRSGAECMACNCALCDLAAAIRNAPMFVCVQCVCMVRKVLVSIQCTFWVRTCVYRQCSTKNKKKFKLMLIIFNMPECKIFDEVYRSCNHFYEYVWKCSHHVDIRKQKHKKADTQQNSNHEPATLE